MTTYIDEYANSVIFSFLGVCAFLLCVVGGIWGYRFWTTRGFYLKDFEKLSVKARTLSAETLRIRKDVELDETAEWSLEIANMEMLTAADEWDSGIRIALLAWDDIMHPNEAPDDVETGKGDKMVMKRRKCHERYVIGLIQRKVMEGVDRRKELSPQLQRMHNEVISRKVDFQSSKLNRRLASGREIKHERAIVPERYRAASVAHAPVESIDCIVPNAIKSLLAPTPSPRAATCPPLEKGSVEARQHNVYI